MAKIAKIAFILIKGTQKRTPNELITEQILLLYLQKDKSDKAKGKNFTKDNFFFAIIKKL